MWVSVPLAGRIPPPTLLARGRGTESGQRRHGEAAVRCRQTSTTRREAGEESPPPATATRSWPVWNVEALARELECSVRTLFRDLNVLNSLECPSTDRQTECYCVAENYRFPRMDRLASVPPGQEALRGLLTTAGQLIADGEKLIAQLGTFAIFSGSPGGKGTGRNSVFLSCPRNDSTLRDIDADFRHLPVL